MPRPITDCSDLDGCADANASQALLLRSGFRRRRPAAIDGHRHAEARAESDERPRVDFVSRHEMKSVLLGERRERQVRFDERELIADAATGPCAEREVDELGPIRALFR